MLRTILIDDEPVILEELASMLALDERIEIVGMFSDPLHLLENGSSLKPDCLFVDIEMPGMSGIELAERLASTDHDPEIVFVTAYNHYATQAFEVDAMDYLLKPIRPERLRKAVDKLMRRHEMQPEPAVNCTIRCFGAFEVLVGERTVKWTRSKSRELLAYLLQYEGRWLTKYKLCDELWNHYDPERALAYLQTSLYALRKNLKAAGCSGIRIDYADNRYILRVEETDWDVRRFDTAYALFRQNGSAEAAKQALQSCRGEYLEGEDWPWSDIAREDYIRRMERLKAGSALL